MCAHTAGELVKRLIAASLQVSTQCAYTDLISTQVLASEHGVAYTPRRICKDWADLLRLARVLSEACHQDLREIDADVEERRRSAMVALGHGFSLPVSRRFAVSMADAEVV